MRLDDRRVGAWAVAIIAVVGIIGAGCGDDGSGDTTAGDTTAADTTAADGASSDGVTSTTGPSTSAASSGDETVGADTSGDDTAGVEIPCGDRLTCTSPEICVPETFEPPCQGYDPKMGETCPPDTMPTNCGGPGGPCCCGTPPPPQYGCVAPEGCEGMVDCSCIACPLDKECVMVPDGFRCDPIPPA